MPDGDGRFDFDWRGPLRTDIPGRYKGSPVEVPKMNGRGMMTDLELIMQASGGGYAGQFDGAGPGNLTPGFEQIEAVAKEEIARGLPVTGTSALVNQWLQKGPVESLSDLGYIPPGRKVEGGVPGVPGRELIPIVGGVAEMPRDYTNGNGLAVPDPSPETQMVPTGQGYQANGQAVQATTAVRTAWRNPVSGGMHYQVGKRSYIYVDPRGYMKKYTLPRLAVVNLRNPNPRTALRAAKALKKTAGAQKKLVAMFYPSQKKPKRHGHTVKSK